MNVNLKFKPFIYKGRNKAEVLSKFKAYGWKSSSCGWYKTDLSGNIVCYNLIKRNRKTQQFRYKSGEKKGKYKESKILHPTEWTAYVYRINEDFAKLIGLVINQRERYFEYKIKQCIK